MARAELQPDSALPAVCVKTGEPANYLFVARVTGVRPGPADAIAMIVGLLWPLAFCLCWLGPALLVSRFGTRLEVPVNRRTLWTLELLRYTTWFVIGGSVVAGVLPGVIAGWCAGGL